MNVKSQVPLPISCKGLLLEAGYGIDILVEGKVVVEIKAVDELADIHTAQILTYLKLTNLKLELLINFNTVKLVVGLKRVVNHL